MKRIITALALTAAMAVSAVEPSGTLPVMYVNTTDGVEITSKDDYVTGTYYVDPCGVEGFEAIGSVDAQLPLQIKGRGNYSWIGFDKKPYRLKLDSKAALLGMKKNKHFALMAHADDAYGFMRNAVGFELSRMLGLAWTPADEPVELVLNGDYKGLYFLTEHIRIDADRVNVAEQEDQATTDVDGGWLVEIDNYDTDPHVTVTEGLNGSFRDGAGNPYYIWFTYKSPEVLSSEQESFLQKEMQRINDLVYAEDKTDCRWADYVDLTELAKYYLVQEIVDDFESFHGSCYLYRDRGADQKWKFGPVWDFGNAFTYSKSSFIAQDRVWHQVWIGEMCKFPEFMDVVKDEYQKFIDSDGLARILAYVDELAAKITPATLSDYERWPQYGTRYEASKAGTVKQCLQRGVNWLNQQWGITPAVDDIELYFYDEAETPWDPVYAFTWDRGADNKTHLGDWPGSLMQATDLTVEGHKVWTIKVTPEEPYSGDLGLIFGNGQSGVEAGNQTDDLVYSPGGLYNRQGLSPKSFDGVISVDAAAPLTIAVRNGALVIDADAATDVDVVRIDGTVTRLNVPAGTSSHTLPRGFYIVAGRKVVL